MQTNNKYQLQTPKKLWPVFAPKRGEVRYRCAWGGRGGGKSFSFAKLAAIWGYVEPLRFLCTRDLQSSIKESFHAELKNAIQSEPWLEQQYHVGVDYLRGKNGSEFIFRGLRHNMSAIKSLAQIDVCIVEEAEDVTENSWKDLLPTIRAPKSEIWVIWNPRVQGSPVDKRFRQSHPPRCVSAKLNWSDNPWLSAELNEARLHDQTYMDGQEYAHVWQGDYYTRTEAQVFGGRWVIEDFTPDSATWDGPYHGLDFGFARDPTACVKCWIYDNVLYVEREAFAVELELDDTPGYVKEHIEGIENYTVRCDSARPESISHLRRHGLPGAEAVGKWPGSVEDGIKVMRAFKRIVVHSRCRQIQKEMQLYSYKVDRLTGDVLPSLVDKHNHGIDAIRYSIAPMIRGGFTDYGAIL